MGSPWHSISKISFNNANSSERTKGEALSSGAGARETASEILLPKKPLPCLFQNFLARACKFQ